MEFEDLRREVESIILSMEDGEKDILGCSNDKFKLARNVLEQYDNKYFFATGQYAKLYNRYLEDRENTAIRKTIPVQYKRWKETGILPIVMSVLQQYRDKDAMRESNSSDIVSRIKNELRANNINEQVSQRIAGEVDNAIENSKYYSEKVIGMNYSTTKLLSDFSYEMRRVASLVRPEEIKEILNTDEHQMLAKIEEVIVRYQGRDNLGQGGLKKIVDESDRLIKTAREAFIDELHVDVDVEKAVKEHEDQQVEDKREVNHKKRAEDYFI